jgi:hypothetical protein
MCNRNEGGTEPSPHLERRANSIKLPRGERHSAPFLQPKQKLDGKLLLWNTLAFCKGTTANSRYTHTPIQRDSLLGIIYSGIFCNIFHFLRQQTLGVERARNQAFKWQTFSTIVYLCN